MKIALVYDRINKFGGAERVLLALHEIWPEAPLFTAVYNRDSAKWADVFQIHTSFLQKVPFAKTHHEFFPFLTPIAFETFDFNSFDVVLSVTSAEAKDVITNSNTLHICYCLTPTRYLWSGRRDYENQGFKGKILNFLSKSLRRQDYISAQRVDKYIAISNEVQQRIQEYYNKESIVIYPPVDTPNTSVILDSTHNSRDRESIQISKLLVNDFYLVVSRLVSYKKIDIAIKAFNKLNKKLIIIGKGKEFNKLKKIAGPTIYFLRDLTDMELSSYYTHCRALIFPTNEDFGISPVEAQAHGKPVIAFGKGGATETIIDKKTGLFFESQSAASLIKAVEKFEKLKFDPKDCKANAKKFSKEIFKSKIKFFVEKSWQEYKN